MFYAKNKTYQKSLIYFVHYGTLIIKRYICQLDTPFLVTALFAFFITIKSYLLTR